MNPYCQFDCIWNPLGDTPLDMPVRGFPKVEPSHGWEIVCIKKEKRKSEQSVGIHLFVS